MKELAIISSKLKAPKDMKNNFGGYAYRNAEGILEAVKPLVLEQDCCLVVNTSIQLIGERYYVEATATITNNQGQQISAKASAREANEKKGMDEAQVTGAATSYAKKYALCNLFSIDDSSLDPDSPDNDPRNSKNAQPKQTVQPKPLTEDEKLCKMLSLCGKPEDVVKFLSENNITDDKKRQEPYASVLAQLRAKFNANK